MRREKEADPYSMDELVVRIACHDQQLVRQVAARTLEVTRVSARVEVVEAREIYDPGQAKVKRFVDAQAIKELGPSLNSPAVIRT